MSKKTARTRAKKSATKKTTTKKPAAAKRAPKPKLTEDEKILLAVKKRVRTPFDLLCWEACVIVKKLDLVADLVIDELRKELGHKDPNQLELPNTGAQRAAAVAAPSLAAAPEPAPAPEPEVKTAAKVEVTNEQIIEALQTVVDKKGIQASMDLLAKYGVKRVPELPPKSRPLILADCAQATA